MEAESKKLSLKKNGLIWTIWNLIESFLLIVMGVLTIVNCKDESLHKNLFIIISIFLIIGGSLRIIANFIPVFIAKNSSEQDKLFIRVNTSYEMSIAGAVELALGISLLVSMTGDNAMSIIKFITDILVYFVSILFIVGGATLIVFSIAFIITKLYKIYVPIVEMIFGLATAGLGVVALIVFGNDNHQTIITVLLVIVGIILVLVGICEAIVTIRPLLKNKSKKEPVKEQKQEVLEAEAKEAEEIKEEEIPAIKNQTPVEIERKEKTEKGRSKKQEK